jgi:outer membrane autotransporter protein
MSSSKGQRRTNLESVSGLPEAKSSLAGGTAGVAWHNEGFALGAAVTQEDGDLDLDGDGSKAGLKSTMPAVFFQYAADKWFVNASAAFSRDDYDLQRRVVFAGFDRTARGTTSGTRNDFTANIGTTFRSPSWVFTPQVGVLASRWELDRFTETGAAGANLAIFDQSTSSLRTRAGFEATAAGQRFSPQIAVFWLHETKDDRSLQAAFAGAGNSPYAAPGRPVDANAIQASLGVDCRLGKHAVLNASVAGLWGGNARVTSDISAAFRWEF